MTHEGAHVYHVLGIDFGTSNSYFSDTRVGGPNPSYTDLKFHNGHCSVPTCVLYQQDGTNWRPESFGEAAIELWKDLTTEERPQYRFRAGFKPDIAFDPQSYQDTVAFFQCARQYLQEQGRIQHFTPRQGRQVIIGIPAKNVAGQEAKTREALAAAGIDEIMLIPEPQGALFYHLFHDRDRITVDKAHQGVVVIDFGGGTFDVAYLQDCQVKRVWGNPLLGGRLFDDLFYQWFLEQQRGDKTRRRMLRDHSLDYLRTFGFRHLKERFSAAWQAQRLERFRERITMGVDYDYGVFRNATAEEFYERAAHYHASAELLQDLELLQEQQTLAKLRHGPLDLMALIKEQLRVPVELTSAHISAVILTGGSCRWPFMSQLASEAFPEAQLFQSPDPEATVSRGLGLAYAMEIYAHQVVIKLEEDQQQLKSEILKVFEECYQEFSQRLAQQFANELYVGVIQPIFVQWREQGGSIAQLESLTTSQGQAYFKAAGQEAVTREKTRLQAQLEHRVRQQVQAWLQAHAVTHTEFLHLDQLPRQDGVEQLNPGIARDLEEFFNTIGYLVGGLISLIIAGMAGGSGMALLMSGPIGWLMGLILGAAGSMMMLRKMDTRQMKLPSWLLRMVATDTRLDEARHKFEQDVRAKLWTVFTDKRAKLVEELERQTPLLIKKIAGKISVISILQ